MLITGDFNIYDDDTSEYHGLAFSKLMSVANLILHVTVPTRVLKKHT